jgi:hypothetical protein
VIGDARLGILASRPFEPRDSHFVIRNRVKERRVLDGVGGDHVGGDQSTGKEGGI